MKVKPYLVAALALLTLTGCGPVEGSASQSVPVPAVSEPLAPGYDPTELPDPALEPEDWTLADFSGCLEPIGYTTRDDYALLGGTELENTVRVLRGEGDGPTLYVVAGVHGDEKAGWMAGNLLKEAELKAGTLYILSPANLYGAEQDQRKTKSDRDLNRSFPGDPGGWDAQRIAAAVFADIEKRQPDLVLDLHEARAKQGERDALGNSIITQSLDGIGDLVLGMVLDSEAGALCAAPLTLYGSPPAGSVNETVTRQLGIPAITVETYREEPLERRVRNQLEILEYVLNAYGMR